MTDLARSTLLVLGSKPDPALPPASAYAHVACANASGYSAARHGLPSPSYTVMTAVLAGKSTGKSSLDAVAGLHTGTLYFFPRPAPRGSAPLRAFSHLKQWRRKPSHLQRRLRALGYRWDAFESRPQHWYHGLVEELVDRDPAILERMRVKQPSTGVVTLAIGMTRGDFTRFVLAGFSFELTHAYGANPEISERGTASSKHADTDVAVMRYLAKRHGTVFTTEPVVAERAGVPLLAGNPS